MSRRRWAAALAAVTWAGAAGAIPVLEEATPYDARHARAAFLTLGAGARSAGLADAFTAIADDASAGWWNPAGLGALAGVTGLLQHELLGNGISLSSAGVAYPLGPGVAGANLLAYGFGDYVLRDEVGTNLGTASDWDLAVTGSWGMANPGWLGGRGWWGVSADVVSESVGGVLVAASLGEIVPVNDRLRLGLAILHLGAGADGGSLPGSVRAGAVWQTAWFWAPAVSLDVAAGLGGQPASVSAGFEAHPARFAALRFGYRWRPDDQGLGALAGVAAGLGVRFGALGVDYAFQPAGSLAVFHRLAITYGRPGVSRPVAPAVADTVPAARTPAPVEAVSAPVSTPPASAPAALPATTAPTSHARAMAGLAAPAASPAAAITGPAKLETPAPAAAPVSPGEASYAEALAYYGAGDMDHAWAKAYFAVTADPGHWQAWQILGNCQYAKGDVKRALASYRKSLKLHPDNPALRDFVQSLGR